MLIASYPNMNKQPEDTVKALTKAIVEIFKGKPKEVVHQAMHPETGITGKYKYLDIHSVVEWFRAYAPAYKVVAPAPVIEDKFVEPTPEERARNLKKLEEISRQIKQRNVL